MKALAFCTVLAALALGACQDSSNVTAPDQSPDLNRAQPPQNPTGAVYVQTNGADKNEVVAYRRVAGGKLELLGTFATGGKGTGVPRLGSQGSVILSHDGRWLLVTNVGSDELSVFAVAGSGLSLVHRVGSGGDMPFSLALHGHLLYVLNAGGSGNITAFTLGSNGHLKPLAHSTRHLSGSVTGSTTAPAPAQVAFSPDGGTLVVTEKATSLIDTYIIGSNGLATGPTVHHSSGETPFGFAFRSDGIFVVTEAHNAATGEASASSYSLAGGFRVVSGSVPDTQTDVCWTVITSDGKYAYITNFGSGTLSSYRIAGHGEITLLKAVAGRTAHAQGPRDQGFSRDGRYLYTIDVGFANAASRAVNAFRVGSDGSLTKVGVFPLPAAYPAVAGLAAE